MARIGEMKCWNPNCSCADVAVTQTAGGKLSGKCHKCQFEHWGPVGTKAQRSMRELMTLDQDDQPPDNPPPAPEKKPAPTPTKKPSANNPFSLSDL